MLRNVVLAIGLAWFAVATWLAVAFGTWTALILPGIVVAGITFERYRYHGNATGEAPGDWRRTAERFIDDETGRPVTVWFNATTGERKYVDE